MAPLTHQRRFAPPSHKWMRTLRFNMSVGRWSCQSSTQCLPAEGAARKLGEAELATLVIYP